MPRRCRENHFWNTNFLVSLSNLLVDYLLIFSPKDTTIFLNRRGLGNTHRQVLEPTYPGRQTDTTILVKHTQTQGQYYRPLLALFRLTR